MNFVSTAAVRRIVLPVLFCFSTTCTNAQSSTPQLVRAADKFLATLDATQRKKVLFSFEDEQQRARWSNFPTGFVPRGGISLKEMNPAQRSAAMALLASALSPRGMEKVQQIMEGDEVNKAEEAKRTKSGNDGNHPPFGQDDKPPLPGNGAGGPPPSGGFGGPPPPGGGPGRPPFLSVTCSAKIFTTFRFSGRPPRRHPGCCSLVATTWRSTSRSQGSAAF